MAIPEITSLSINGNSQVNPINFSLPKTTRIKYEPDKYESQNEKTSGKMHWYIAGGIALIGAAALIVNFIRKPSKAAAGAKKTIGQLTNNTPANKGVQDKKLADEFYKVLDKNQKKLEIKPEDYHKITSNIRPEDDIDFILKEGIAIIASRAKKIKEDTGLFSWIDLGVLIRSLNKNNIPCFNEITSNLKKYEIENSLDIASYLEELNPKRYDYMFKKLMPKIEKHKEFFNSTERIISTLNHITPETEDLIPRILKKYPNEGDINKLSVLTNATKDNKECAVNFVKNFKNLGLSNNEIIEKMKTMTDNNSKSIDVVADNIGLLKELVQKENEKYGKTFDIGELFNLTNYQATVADTVLKKPDLYKINYSFDIADYLQLKPKQFEFMQTHVIEKLIKYQKELGIKASDDITDIVKILKPKTVHSIDIVGEYAKKIHTKPGTSVNYICLFADINEKNVKNVERGMKIIAKNPEAWTGYECDFKKLFDNAK